MSKSLPINAYTASGAMTIVRRAARQNGYKITNVVATLRPRSGWLADKDVAAYETTDHAGQRNVTYDVTFDITSKG